jgi:hypothetical protein
MKITEPINIQLHYLGISKIRNLKFKINKILDSYFL